MSTNEEVWKYYEGVHVELHGLLVVSSLGRFYKVGQNTSKNQSKILKGSVNAYGYHKIHLSIDSKSKIYNSHRLVAETFCKRGEGKDYVDHINAIRDDNRAVNLRWVTHSENCNNPIYTSKLGSRSSKHLSNFNYLKEALKKPCYAEHTSGEMLHFESLQDMGTHFGYSSRIRRKDTGEYYTIGKLAGWRFFTK